MRSSRVRMVEVRDWGRKRWTCFRQEKMASSRSVSECSSRLDVVRLGVRCFLICWARRSTENVPSVSSMMTHASLPPEDFGQTAIAVRQ